MILEFAVAEQTCGVSSAALPSSSTSNMSAFEQGRYRLLTMQAQLRPSSVVRYIITSAKGPHRDIRTD